MASSIQNYYPGGSRTVSSGSGGGGASYAPAFQLAEMLRRQRQAAVPPPVPQGVQPSIFGVGRGPARPGSAPQRHVMDVSNNDPVERAEQMARMAQARAISDPAPMRMTTFASGANNFMTPDVGAMTGAQRQMFLPKGAEQTPIGAAAGWGGGPSLEDQYQEFLRASEQRRAIDERERGGGPRTSGRGR